MAMVCPRCQGAFEGQPQCPRCRVPLVHPSELGRRPSAEEKWHQTPFGRTVAGLVLALGLGVGLLNFFASSLALLEQQGGKELSPALGLALFVGLQAAGVLLGATLAGVGRRKGAAYGVVVGLLASAVVLAGVRAGQLVYLSQAFVGDLLSGGADDRLLAAGVPLRLAVLYGMPVVFLVCGLMGGFVGSQIWKPPASLSMPTFVAVPKKPVQDLSSSGLYRPAPKAEPSQWSGPVAWLRVLCGIGVAFAGTYMNKQILDLAQRLTDGAIHFTNNYQEAIAVRAICAGSTFLGACVAGATRPNGMKQGLIAGIGAAFLQGAYFVNLPDGKESLPYVIASALLLAPVGGWFGSSLLPPAAPK